MVVSRLSYTDFAFKRRVPVQLCGARVDFAMLVMVQCIFRMLILVCDYAILEFFFFLRRQRFSF